MTKALADAAEAEEGNSQIMSFGSTLLILFSTFGALVAAVRAACMLAVTAVFGTRGVVAHRQPADADRRHRACRRSC